MKKGLTIVLGIMLIFSGNTTLFAGDFEFFITGKKLDLSMQEMENNQLMVSVRDENGDPIRGLTADDFAIGSGISKVRLCSVEPLETSKDLPLNMVLVVDNSFSMKERQAVKPLLAALDEVFKTVRAIDNVHIVVFDDKQTTTVGNRELHGKRFQSSDGSELGQFMDDAFNRSSSGKTYLNEAMLVGLDIISRMPAKEQKFMVVFSDGEDLNSTFDKTDVTVAAFGIENFEAYCIDYMPGTKKNDFLTSFARTNNGRIWKATSASELLPIFQAFSSTLLYRYIISYEYEEPIRIQPLDLNFQILTTLDGSALSNKVFFEVGNSEIPSKYIRFKNRSQTESFDPKFQVGQIEKYRNILNIVGRKLRQNPEAGIQIVGCNSNTGVENGNLALSQRRGETVKEYLQSVWEIENQRMTVVARNLPMNFASAGSMGGRAENQQVEIIYTADELQSQSLAEFVEETDGVTHVTIKTHIFSEHGFADWELAIYADEQALKTLKGRDAPESEYTFFLDDLGPENLVGSNTLEARIKVVDLEGRTYEAASDLCHIRVARKEIIHELIPAPRGGLVLEPETLVIEEITTIESAPLLNYIFFDTGEREIPERYNIFTKQEDTKNFDERNLKGVMQKYQHGLNIIGKRLNETPGADILIVGCNSNHGIEHGKTDLSRGRAEAVRAYLRYIWGVQPSRMQVEARNLPAAASSSGSEEGREENQRVEIYSADPLVLDTINSNFVEAVSNADYLKIIPDIHTGYDLSRWTIQLAGGGNPIESLNGEGELSPHYSLDMDNINLYEAANFGQITAAIEVVDKRGQTYRAEGVSSVQFVKRSERLAQREGYKVLEKYALILFDFNSAEIKERNKIVLDRILGRIKEVANVSVRIVGHTDTIGKEEYNLALSKRRARAAYEQILAGGVISPEKVTYEGAGPHNPLYDNAFPGGRALNRTVTVTLEYEQQE